VVATPLVDIASSFVAKYNIPLKWALASLFHQGVLVYANALEALGGAVRGSAPWAGADRRACPKQM